jgi:hypothetical protein
VTGTRVDPALLATAIARAHRGHERLHVVIPAVLPSTLPLSAMPERLAERVNTLRQVAIEAFARLQARGRIEIVPTRDARLALHPTVAGTPDQVFLVGAAGWLLRRAAHAIAPVALIEEPPSRPHRDAVLRVMGAFSESIEAARRRLRPMTFRSRYQAAAVARTGRGLPRPGHALAPYAAILVAAGLFVGGHALPLRSAVAIAAAAALAGAVAAGWSCAQRAHLRDRADRFIAAGEGAAPSAAVLEQRRAELVSRRERRTLAAAVGRVVTSAQMPPRRSAQVPVDRPAVRAEQARLERLAALLADTDVPVPARGVARTHVLVTDPASPIYRGAAAELHRQLIQTLFEIERGG